MGYKWIFKVNRHLNGLIARHKVGLMVKGFRKELNLDYGETFSPVVNPTRMRLVFGLAAHFNIHLDS